jgi:hypothetical protein
MKLRQTIRKVLREEHEETNSKFKVFVMRRDYEIKETIREMIETFRHSFTIMDDRIVKGLIHFIIAKFAGNNDVTLNSDEYDWVAEYIKNNYTDYIIEQLKLGEEKNEGINESISPWILRRFDIDELDDLVKDVKDQIEEGQTMIDAIYDTVRQFIATKQFNDIDNAGTEQEYWDSYLVYEKPLIKFVKEKLESEKGEMKEEELTEKCWAGYTQKGMKTMFGKRYPNCVKKKK